MSVQDFNHSVWEHPGPSVYSLLFTSFVFLIEFPPFKYQFKTLRPLHEEKQTWKRPQSKPEPCWKIYICVCCGFFILWMSDQHLHLHLQFKPHASAIEILEMIKNSIKLLKCTFSMNSERNKEGKLTSAWHWNNNVNSVFSSITPIQSEVSPVWNYAVIIAGTNCCLLECPVISFPVERNGDFAASYFGLLLRRLLQSTV